MISFPTSTGPLISRVFNDPHCSIQTPRASGSQSAANRIALIDSLSKQLPNSGFEQSTVASAQKAGYAFDYYSANSTTVDFFMNLPKMNYKIVILRTHGGMAFLTTSELYSDQRRVMDQLLDRVGAVDVNGTVYFGLYPKSVTELMCGRFQGTLILAIWDSMELSRNGETSEPIDYNLLALNNCVSYRGLAIEPQPNVDPYETLAHVLHELALGFRVEIPA